MPMTGGEPLDGSDPQSERDVPDTPLARATRLAVGAAVLGAAGVSWLVTQRGRGGAPGSPTMPDAAAFVAAGLVAAAVEVERRTTETARMATGLARTTVDAARLTPLRRWVDQASHRMDEWTAVGRSEAELGGKRVNEVWDTLLGEVIGQVLRRVDVNELAGTIDLDAIIDRVDIERVLGRVDLDEIAGRIDIEAIIHRLDLARIAREVLDEIGVEDLIRKSSGSLTVQTVDALRSTGADADRRLAGVVDRVLRRQREREVRIENGGGSAHDGIADQPTGPAASGPR
jgi:hypothetical protein